MVAAAPLSPVLDQSDAIGLSTQFLQESEARLTLVEAVAADKAGRFAAGTSPVLNFGIGAKPVWIHFAVDNPTATPVHRRLSLETSWLDNVEVYFQYQGKTVASYRVGDDRPFSQRPIESRYFMFDHAFASGVSEVYLRVETADPMVVPIYLLSADAVHTREAQQEHSYGIVYGFLLALLAYNAMLYASLRSDRFLFYALYLAMFVIMNIAYTGHGFAWLWPDSVTWQLWSNPTLIYLYGLSGLLFATRFLDTREHFPRVHKAVLGYCAAFGGLLLAAIVLGSQRYALLASFTFVFLFTIVMLLLGVMSVAAGQKAAKYFLMAAISAMIGAALTTLSTWSFIPHNAWTFRAVEIGMLADATLLALALAYQFRVGQQEKIRAEQLAQLDPLTGLNNRRAFYDKTAPLWCLARRNESDVSIILLDIDMFKQVNDAYGHAHGDQVLIAATQALQKTMRQSDILARWGGEEFIVLLPETNIDESAALAERLRVAVSSIRVPHNGGETIITASFGVAQKNSQHTTLDTLISTADACLYQSKQEGRNRVTYCADKPPPTPMHELMA